MLHNKHKSIKLLEKMKRSPPAPKFPPEVSIKGPSDAGFPPNPSSNISDISLSSNIEEEKIVIKTETPRKNRVTRKYRKNDIVRSKYSSLDKQIKYLLCLLIVAGHSRSPPDKSFGITRSRKLS